MSKTFNTSAKISAVKEPLFQLSRAPYKGIRSSQQENVESNLLRIDIARIYSELEEIDTSILSNLELIVGNRANIEDDTYLDDGLVSFIDGIEFKIDEKDIESSIQIKASETLSGILTRLLFKVRQLETGE